MIPGAVVVHRQLDLLVTGLRRENERVLERPHGPLHLGVAEEDLVITGVVGREIQLVEVGGGGRTRDKQPEQGTEEETDKVHGRRER